MPSVALAIAKRLPAARTIAQLMSPCHFDTSTPST
jgi:hypothetical protein